MIRRANKINDFKFNAILAQNALALTFSILMLNGL